MPRVKKSLDNTEEKTTIKKSRSKSKTPAASKKTTPKKKAKPVVVDVIEDDEDEQPYYQENIVAEEVESAPEYIPNEIAEAYSEEEDMPEDIDQQKKFYSELVTEIKEKNPRISGLNRFDEEARGEGPKIKKSIGLYRRLVWKFIVFTLILVFVVFYFSFSKLTIKISPKGENINDSILMKIEPAGADDKATDNDFRELVDGTVKQAEITEEKTFPATGEEFVGEEISGQVKIINNSNKSQALVATTRILSPDNKLYRIKDAVNVPAGGEVSVDIYADKPSEELAIGPTNFTIPGLWLGLQDKIFAKSTSNFVFQQKVKKYIKASDIDRATKDMNDLLIAKAKLGATGSAANSETLYQTLDSANFEIDSKAGDAKESFNVKAKGNLVVVTFSKDQAAKLAAAKLALLVPDDKELVDYKPSDISYSFDNYDSKTGIATVKASFSGTMVLKSNTELIDKKQLVNLSRQQLENYLKSFPEIKDYQLIFFPSFITHAPRLPERINIEVSGLEK